MTRWFHNEHAQSITKLMELVGVSCLVKLDTEEEHGVIEEIAEIVAACDTQTINLSKFKVRLESGHIVIVPGSALSRIDEQVVAS